MKLRVTGLLWLMLAAPLLAQEPAAKKPAEPLTDQQAAIARQYREFESVLQRMADLLQKADPDRSALMSKAFAKSKKDLVTVQFNKLVEQFRAGDLGSALKDQESLLEDMAALLDLLLSEDRVRQLREQRERTEKHIKDIQLLTRKQKELRAETERAEAGDKASDNKQGKPEGDAKDSTDAKSSKGKADSAGSKELAQRQGKLSGETRKLGESMKRDEQSSKGSPGGEGSQEGQGEGKPQDGGQPGQPGQPKGEGQPKDSSPQEGKADSQQAAKPEKNPGSKSVENASRAMEKAKKELEDLKRQNASRSQDEAIRQLQQAVKELEEILRQLREEEQERLLASLETRFKRMLEMQRIVYEGTVQLDRIPADKRTRTEEQKSIALSTRENAIIVEVEQALLLLREDGASIAFAEVVEQLRDDVALVVSLLAKAETGSFTQNIESDIMLSLGEMIESLQRKLQELRDKANQPSQGGGKANSALVDRLAELKMIRSLQKRVNDRTDQVAGLLQSGKPPGEEILKTLRDLAQRQDRIYQITHDITVGKNQ